MNAPHKLRLAIAGGGIGGLSLAVALSHLGVDEAIQIDVYEAATKLTQVGAGISLWPRGWDILKDLKLDKDLAAHLNPGQEIPSRDTLRRSFTFTKSDQGKDVFIADLTIPGGSVSFHRADVLTVLLEHISSRITVHLNHRLASYSETDKGIELTFKNGETAIHDMLIGADGINSVVRKGFLAQQYGLTKEAAEHEARPLWSGTTVYRSLIDSEIIRKAKPSHTALGGFACCLGGKNKHIVSYPVSQGKSLNIVAFYSEPDKENTLLDGPAVIPFTTDNVSAKYTGWSEDAKIITDNMINPSRWAIEIVKPLDKYGEGRVALLGDSAHAMPPHLGNGAGQALEDAYILAHLLSASLKKDNAQTIDVSKVINIYSSIRQPFANFVAKTSLEQGKNFEFSTPEFADIGEGDEVSSERFAELQQRTTENYRWTWETSITTHLEKALAML